MNNRNLDRNVKRLKADVDGVLFDLVTEIDEKETAINILQDEVDKLNDEVDALTEEIQKLKSQLEQWTY